MLTFLNLLPEVTKIVYTPDEVRVYGDTKRIAELVSERFDVKTFAESDGSSTIVDVYNTITVLVYRPEFQELDFNYFELKQECEFILGLKIQDLKPSVLKNILRLSIYKDKIPVITACLSKGIEKNFEEYSVLPVFSVIEYARYILDSYKINGEQFFDKTSDAVELAKFGEILLQDKFSAFTEYGLLVKSNLSWFSTYN